ncbi:MAG: response regulator transcription factor [Lachnospiraceae bacterium]|nr:response regulator transcription factor [Lachnospiraceae bacterium]
MALIYIVEDDEGIREIEEFALKNAGHKVVGFENAKGFYKQLEAVLPDLILLDVMLPDENGNEIVRKLRSNPNTKQVPVIMVTAKTTELDLVKGLDGGADDYIKKPFSVMELISRVKALLRRTEPAEAKVLCMEEITLNDEKHEVTIEGNHVDLTFKEYELLRYLMANKGIVLSRDSIMERIWGVTYEGESRTLDMHIKTLRHKLGDSGNRIRTVRNVGYVIE